MTERTAAVVAATTVPTVEGRRVPGVQGDGAVGTPKADIPSAAAPLPGVVRAVAERAVPQVGVTTAEADIARPLKPLRARPKGRGCLELEGRVRQTEHKPGRAAQGVQPVVEEGTSALGAP